ncbi:MAG: hypothetical protein L3J52_09550, partial [Proteobacteria bacterium]|nr:hypothetical protein [Pseudomonadota bacterium]
ILADAEFNSAVKDRMDIYRNHDEKIHLGYLMAGECQKSIDEIVGLNKKMLSIILCWAIFSIVLILICQKISMLKHVVLSNYPH